MDVFLNFSPTPETMRYSTKKYKPDSLRILCIVCHLTMVCALTAHAGVDVPNSVVGSAQSIGVDSDVDALLRILADLAREGAPALCNSGYLEKRLNIKIDSPRTSASNKSRATFSEVNPVSANSKFSLAIYGTFSDSFIKECYISIDFDKPFLCNTQSDYVKSILGDHIEYTAPNPGRSTKGISYKSQSTLVGVSKVSLGTMDDKCAYGFSVSNQVVRK